MPFILFTKTIALLKPAKWFRYLCQKYPDQLITGSLRFLPSQMTLDEFAIARVQGDVEDSLAGSRRQRQSKDCSHGHTMNWPSETTTATPVSSCSPVKFTSVISQNYLRQRATAYWAAAICRHQSQCVESIARSKARNILCHARRDSHTTRSAGGIQPATCICYFNQHAVECFNKHKRSNCARQIIFDAAR